jgi:polyhydroxybutyrate depolymerase
VLDFHGTGDPIVPYSGGTPVSPVPLGAGTEFRSVPATIDGWRAIDRCADPPASVYQHGDASCTRWTCDAGSHVELCIVTGGGHTWPGGLDYPVLGKTSHDIVATDMILDFFIAHPMP